jgi:hypothetical protein
LLKRAGAEHGFVVNSSASNSIEPSQEQEQPSGGQENVDLQNLEIVGESYRCERFKINRSEQHCFSEESGEVPSQPTLLRFDLVFPVEFQKTNKRPFSGALTRKESL